MLGHPRSCIGFDGRLPKKVHVLSQSRCRGAGPGAPVLVPADLARGRPASEIRRHDHTPSGQSARAPRDRGGHIRHAGPRAGAHVRAATGVRELHDRQGRPVRTLRHGNAPHGRVSSVRRGGPQTADARVLQPRVRCGSEPPILCRMGEGGRVAGPRRHPARPARRQRGRGFPGAAHASLGTRVRGRCGQRGDRGVRRVGQRLYGVPPRRGSEAEGRAGSGDVLRRRADHGVPPRPAGAVRACRAGSARSESGHHRGSRRSRCRRMLR